MNMLLCVVKMRMVGMRFIRFVGMGMCSIWSICCFMG